MNFELSLDHFLPKWRRTEFCSQKRWTITSLVRSWEFPSRRYTIFFFVDILDIPFELLLLLLCHFNFSEVHFKWVVQKSSFLGKESVK